jgi:hypothetical protein
MSLLAPSHASPCCIAQTGGGGGDGFEVTKFGDGRVALIGFPSVGKSTLLTQLTGTTSEVAAYEFTTLTCIPGIIHYNDAKIQLLDLPGIIEGASEGKGERSRQPGLGWGPGGGGVCEAALIGRWSCGALRGVWSLPDVPAMYSRPRAQAAGARSSLCASLPTFC